MRTCYLFAVILLAAVCIAGCTAPSSPAQPSATSPAHSAAPTESLNTAGTAQASGEIVYVRIRDSHFDPEILTIKTGTTVIWTNEDKILHTVTHLAPANDIELFDSGDLESGRTFSYTFSKAGRYNYGDVKHAGATYLIIVE